MVEIYDTWHDTQKTRVHWLTRVNVERRSEIAREVANSDLLVCEGMFESALEQSAIEKKHMTAVQAARVARDAGGVKKLALIHYSPRYAERDLKRLLDEAREIFPGSILSRDRLNIPIEYVD